MNNMDRNFLRYLWCLTGIKGLGAALKVIGSYVGNGSAQERMFVMVAIPLAVALFLVSLKAFKQSFVAALDDDEE